MTPLIARGVSDAQQDQLTTSFRHTSRAGRARLPPRPLYGFVGPLITTAQVDYAWITGASLTRPHPRSAVLSTPRAHVATPSAMTVLAGAPQKLSIGTYVISNKPVVVHENVR